MPTSLLAQVDSSVGGKTGINTAQGKNLIGSFYQPAAVIADIESLSTLPRRELLAGYAEVLKYGLIRDFAFFQWMEENGEKICNLDAEAIAYAVETSCRAKATLVQADETEQGSRALLNLGHTFGHALEAEAGYNGSLLHGEGVAIGMVMAFDLSYRMGLCSQEDLERVQNHLQNVGLPTTAASIDPLATSVDRLIAAMGHDKKVKDGKLTFVLVNAIGEAFLSSDVPMDKVRNVLRDSLGGETKSAQGGIIRGGIKGRWASAFSSQS
jgi:3-dehydroquinate synthase